MNDIFSLAEGMTLQNGKYTIIRMLSHGGFGVTPDFVNVSPKIRR